METRPSEVKPTRVEVGQRWDCAGDKYTILRKTGDVWTLWWDDLKRESSGAFKDHEILCDTYLGGPEPATPPVPAVGQAESLSSPQTVPSVSKPAEYRIVGIDWGAGVPVKREVSHNGRDWTPYEKLTDADPFDSYRHRRENGVVVAMAVESPVVSKVYDAWKTCAWIKMPYHVRCNNVARGGVPFCEAHIEEVMSRTQARAGSAATEQKRFCYPPVDDFDLLPDMDVSK